MYIKSIDVKNFLSYGNNPTKYIFDKHNVTLIYAKNGKGKSSIIDALTFVLFGKAFRNIKKDLLVNTDNKKECVVGCDLIGDNNKNVRIVRGIKPNKFEIYEDGELVNQFAESKDYQNYLESYILGMNFITFIQTVIISKTKYVPFMRLKTPDRRAFVESVLGIEVFGDMQKLQSKSVSSLKEEINTSEYDLKIHSNNIQAELRILKNVIDMVNKSKDESLGNRDREVADANALIEFKTNEINELLASVYADDYLDDYTKKLALDKKNIEFDSKIKTIKNNIKNAKGESDTCSLCGGQVDISHIEDHVKSLEVDLNAAELLKFKISARLVQLNENYNIHIESKDNNNVIRSTVTRLKSDISSLKSKIYEIENRVIDTSDYDQQIADLKTKIIAMKAVEADHSSSISDTRIKLDSHNLALSVLKDTGIKSAIINNSIPTINNIINEYLHKFGFYIRFTLNSDFEETIKFKTIDYLVYDSFSEGEKLRIDLALIFAWRKIALIQSGTSCNLLFFDEITDASMDDEGVELFIKSLNSLTDTNTWIISHTPEKIESYVRGVINLDKVNGFTVITKNK